MNLLITGATSGLGRNAVEILCAQGVHVRATGRNTESGSALQALGAQFIAVDLARLAPPQADALLDGIDTVWHCAALSAPWGQPADFHAANVLATQQLADAAVRAGVRRFVHISTPSLYFDYQHHHAVPESYKPRRYVNHYARTKALAEALIRERATAHPQTTFVILRPRALFGAHDRVLLPRVMQQVNRHGGVLSLPRGGQALMDFTFTPNVVEAMQAASLHPQLRSGAAYNVTNHAPQRLGEVLMHLLHGELGVPLRLRSVPYPLADGVARASEAWAHLRGHEPDLTRYGIGALHFDMTLDNTRALYELRYQPRYGMDEGIARTAAWLREQAFFNA